MNNMYSLQETVLRDVIDVAQGLKDSDEYQALCNFKNGSYAGRSIAARSQALTLVFPMYCDSSLSAKTMALHAKAMERKCVTMLQMLFAAANITNAKNGIDYLKKFHTNLDTAGPSLGIDDLIGQLDRITEETMATQESSSEKENYVRIREEVRNEFNTYLPDVRFVVEQNDLMNYQIFNENGRQHVILNEKKKETDWKKQLEDIKDELPEEPGFSIITKQNWHSVKNDTDFYRSSQLQSEIDSLNDEIDGYKQQINDLMGKLNMSQQDLKDREDFLNFVSDREASAIKYYNKATAAQNGANKQKEHNAKVKSELDNYKKQLETKSRILNKQMNKYKMSKSDQAELERLRKGINNAASRRADIINNLDLQDVASQKLAADMFKANMDVNKNRVLNTEVKKNNELEPTLMFVNFITLDKESEYPIYNTMVIGVKCKVYTVAPQDIVDHLVAKNKRNNTLLGFVRATTKEISFFKDFIACIDQAKIDAISQSRLGSSNKMWKVLERRAAKKKLMKGLMLKNNAAPITTLMISQETVEYMKKVSYLDIENPSVMVPLLDSYNLMAAIITDESLEVSKFLFDTGEDTYEVMTYDSLEKEEKDSSKKLMNIMAKVAR